MKIIKTSLLLFTLFCSLSTMTLAHGPNSPFCKVMKDWASREYTPVNLCKKYGGSFCSDMDTNDKAICAASGKAFCSSIKNLGEGICKAGDGHFCDSVKSIGGGLCTALDGHFCDVITSSSDDEAKWINKLNDVCQINQTSTPKSPFCKIMKDWASREYTPVNLCKKYGGSFCSDMDTNDKAICAASGKAFCSSIKNLGGGICKAGDGHFCDSVKSIGGGLCTALNGHFCDTIAPSSDDETKWMKKLNEFCHF